MSDNYYGQGLYYGAGHFWGGANDVDVPKDYQWFRTNIENIYVFHWGFDPLYISPTLATLDWEVQIDTVPTFDSPNLVSYTKTTAFGFQNGNVAKGYEIEVAARLDFVTQQFYTRVRTIHGSAFSGWSDTVPFTVPPLFIEQTAENLLNYLPDNNVYNKDILNLPPAQRTTNLYALQYRGYGKQFDALRLERILTIGDAFVRAARDEALYDNFGTYFRYIKPQSMTNVEYRRALECMLITSLKAGTLDAISCVAKGFTGVPPTVSNVRDSLAFIAVVSESDPDVTYLDDLSVDEQPVLIDTSDAGFGITVFLNNPGGFTLDMDLITFLIKNIVPAHINVQVLA